MLVNEGCIVDCMWKNFDDMMISQTTKKSNMKVIQFVHNFLLLFESLYIHILHLISILSLVTII